MDILSIKKPKSEEFSESEFSESGNSNPENPSNSRTPSSASAKINLGLEVLYERPDGYHELSTLFLRVDEPHDIISISAGEAFQLTCSDPSLPTDDRNLMMRTAREFERMTGEALPPLHVHLEKRIPMGAGLGGGSSDAAMMLTILLEHRKNSTPQPPPLSEEGEFMLAAKIGADVPFFYSGVHAAAATGIGEKLTPIDVHIPGSILIVADPTIHVSTKEAYASLSPSVKSPSVDYTKFFQTPPQLKTWKEDLNNDFEPGIFRRFPHLAEIKHALYARGADFALMSGSGSALYGIFRDANTAQEAKQSFESERLLTFLNMGHSVSKK